MESIPKILSSLNEVNKALDVVKKDQQGYGYKFRGIDAALNALGPLLKKHGILTIRKNLQVQRAIRTLQNEKSNKEVVEVEATCEYVFKSLLDGSEVSTEAYGEGQDKANSDKASAMAQSNMYKYAIYHMFNISTEDQIDSDMQTAIENKDVGHSEKFSKEQPQSSFRKRVIPRLDGGEDSI